MRCRWLFGWKYGTYDVYFKFLYVRKDDEDICEIIFASNEEGKPFDQAHKLGISTSGSSNLVRGDQASAVQWRNFCEEARSHYVVMLWLRGLDNPQLPESTLVVRPVQQHSTPTLNCYYPGTLIPVDDSSVDKEAWRHSGRSIKYIICQFVRGKLNPKEIWTYGTIAYEVCSEVVIESALCQIGYRVVTKRWGLAFLEMNLEPDEGESPKRHIVSCENWKKNHIYRLPTAWTCVGSLLIDGMDLDDAEAEFNRLLSIEKERKKALDTKSKEAFNTVNVRLSADRTDNKNKTLELKIPTDGDGSGSQEVSKVTHPRHTLQSVSLQKR